MENFKFFIFYLIISFGGMFLELLIYRMFFRRADKKYSQENSFSYLQYSLFLIPPILGLVILTMQVGFNPLKMYLIFIVIGPIIEWFLGYLFDLFFGERLWTYHRLNISKYTSWLSLPFWGNAGVLFWLLAKELIK